MEATIEIEHVENKKYILTRTDDTYLFDEFTFLFHMTNLTKILKAYDQIFDKNSYPTLEEQILMKKIETLIDQLNEHRIEKRGLNFLGSTLKFITGIPDHDDLIEIETKINTLIENNEKQRIINSRFEKMLDSIQREPTETYIAIKLIHEQLLTLVRTINAAKNNEYLTESLNLNDVRELTVHKLKSVPIINILEYSDIYITRTNDSIITIYKYPIINNYCKLFKFTSLSVKHGKVSTDKEIASCNNVYTRVHNCKNFLGKNICKTNTTKDDCIIPLLENRKAKCIVLQEYNHPLLKIDEGFILLDGVNTVNDENITGTILVKYTDRVMINNITFINIHDKLIETIIKKHDEDIEITKILTSSSELAFNNIDSLRKFVIPIETHPFRYSLYIILAIITTTALVYIILKATKYYLTLRAIRTRENFQVLYNTELERIRHEISINQA